MEFSITLNNEDERSVYRLELMNNEKFLFPIYGVSISLEEIA